jgi:signal transduction histidine kinase/CheY-like chemotaxis protein
VLVGTPAGSVVALGNDGSSRRLPIAHVGTVLGVFRDGPSRTWVSADSGLFRVEGGGATRMNSALGLPPRAKPRAVWRDAAGRLIIGNPGVTVVDGDRVRHYGVAEGLTDLDVRAVFPRGRHVWIGTRSNGLYVLVGDTIRHLGALDPALNHDVIGIGDDALGYLWLTQRFSVTRVRIADLTRRLAGEMGPVSLRAFNAADGLPAARFNDDYQSTIARDANGHLWLPNAAGVVRVDPAAVREDSAPPAVIVERMVVGGADRAPDDSSPLPSGVGRLAFAVSVPGVLKPTAVRLQYRVLGSDTLWTDAGMNRFIALGPLRGGDYRLELRAASEPGRWGRVTARDFSVARTLVERSWFLPVVLLLTAGLVVGAATYRQRQLVAYNVALERTVSERTHELEVERASLETRVRERTAELTGELARRSRLESDLVQAQKLEGMGRLAGGVAHEVNNSMASLLAFAQLATRSARDRPDILEDLAEMRRAGQRVAGVMRQLLQFSRRQSLTLAPLDVRAFVHSMERAVRQAAGDNIVVIITADDDVPVVPADRERLEQVILNLVLNARHAIPDRGAITIHTRRERLGEVTAAGGASLGPGEYAVVSVTDTGVGMTDDVQSRVFEPFFTTKPEEGGSGLGLPVCHGIVQQHGGDIRVRSAPGQGATLEVWLPVAGRSSDAGDIEAALEASVDGRPLEGGTVLVVDDEPLIRESVRRHLVREKFTVVTAGSGAEALELLAEAAAAVDVIVSDVRMPGMTGLEMARELQARHGRIPMVFISGFIGGNATPERELQAYGPVVAKPFEAATLLAAVRSAMSITVSR